MYAGIAGDGFGLLVVSTAPGQVLEGVLDRLTTALRGLLLPDLDGVDTPEQQIAIARQKAGISPRESVKLQRFEVIRHV